MKEGSCQWTKDGYGLGVDPLLSSYPRLMMRDCNLDISPLLPSDEGVYQCQVSGVAIEDGVDMKIVQMEDGKTFKSISTLRYTPLSDTEITCSAQNSVFPSPKTSVILIKHLQKPKVYLDLGSPEVQTGDSLNITCNTVAYPESVRYSWYLNGQVIVSEKSATMMINTITKTANMVGIRCRAVNRVGWG